MKKILLAVLTAITLTSPVQAGLLDNVGKAISGHVKDLSSRITEDQILDNAETIKEGVFREDDPGQDFVHNGEGSVSLVLKDETFYIQLNEDFSSTPGPDYHVYVSTESDIDREYRFQTTDQYELGALKKGSGASYYEITDISPEDILSVTIWCKDFGEFIASANIE